MDSGNGASIGIRHGAAMTYQTELVFCSMGGGPEWADPGSVPITGNEYLEWFNNLLRQKDLSQTNHQHIINSHRTGSPGGIHVFIVQPVCAAR